MARPMPVLPEVPSTIVPPGFRRPARSASSIIFTAMRSLIELPGLNVSSFARTVPLTTPLVIRLMRTIGVSPIASRIVSQIFFTLRVYTREAGTRDLGFGIRDLQARRHAARVESRFTNPDESRIPNPESQVGDRHACQHLSRRRPSLPLRAR